MPRVKKQLRVNLGMLNANQVVATNMRELRKSAAMTQTMLAEKLTAFTGRRFTKATISAMELSATGRRRVFDAHDLMELACVFDVPVTYLLTPTPALCHQRLDIQGERYGHDIVQVLYGSVAGEQKNFERLRELEKAGFFWVDGSCDRVTTVELQQMAARQAAALHRVRAVVSELQSLADELVTADQKEASRRPVSAVARAS